MNTVTSKIALVTGASRGLGRSTALALARSGVDVIVTYRQQEEQAREVARAIEAEGRKAVALQLDTADTRAFPSFVTRLGDALTATWSRGTFDILVNNAGLGLVSPFATTTEATFDQLMAVHVKGVYFLTQALLPAIDDGGRIINLSSGLARFVLPGYSAYAMMKGAIEVLTRYLAKELGPRRIAVNAVAPGAIATDFAGGVVRDNAQLNATIGGQTALGRVGEPEDIGPLIALLVSDSARWVTGQRIEASGGMFL